MTSQPSRLQIAAGVTAVMPGEALVLREKKNPAEAGFE
jgi:hypothetical protein